MPSPVAQAILPILRSHSRNLITILKILSFFTKMHSPDCRNFTGSLTQRAHSAVHIILIEIQIVYKTSFEWGGGTLIFSHIRRLRLFWGIQILNFNIFWVFRKKKIVWGMKIVWLLFSLGGGGGPHKK